MHCEMMCATQKHEEKEKEDGDNECGKSNMKTSRKESQPAKKTDSKGNRKKRGRQAHRESAQLLLMRKIMLKDQTVMILEMLELGHAMAGVGKDESQHVQAQMLTEKNQWGCQHRLLRLVFAFGVHNNGEEQSCCRHRSNLFRDKTQKQENKEINHTVENRRELFMLPHRASFLRESSSLLCVISVICQSRHIVSPPPLMR